jgi:tRNA (guanine37-N1)-methyltransferase
VDGNLAAFHLHNIRDFADNKHAKVDDRPFGGGPGMVMMCQPLFDCVQAAEQQDNRPAQRVLLTPQGQPLTQQIVEDLATHDRLLLIAGHYEGVDERVIDALQPREISAGDYVLSGGELPAMMLIDAIVRLIPGALGHEDSAAEDSFAIRDLPGTDGARLLDCPHYTRPRIWNDRVVPDVLLSGDHQAVAQWRMKQMIERTRRRRPDLLPGRDP